MNLIDAVELLDVVSDFDFKGSDKIPNISIFDNQKEGFVLCVKANVVTKEYLEYLKGIAKSHNLGMRKLEDYLIIHGY